jgi:hypothetical protein
MTFVRRALPCVAAAVLALGVLSSGAVQAASSGTTVTGAAGQQLTVSQTEDIAASGEQLTVTGAGYDDFKGVYLAVCLLPAPGERPTPCGGGIDMSGESQTSVWISSNPPSYAKGLTTPYGPDGSFEATVFASSSLPDGRDCRDVPCALVSRADHTRSSDRTQDVLIPLTFSAQDEDSAPPALLAGVGIGVVVLLAAFPLGVLAADRRRRGDAAEPGSTGARA